MPHPPPTASSGRPTVAARLQPYLGAELASLDVEQPLELSPVGIGGFREIQHPSRIVREHSEPGEGIGDVYRSMRQRDTQLAGFWSKRRKAVLALPRFLKPADSSPRAREVADFVRQALGLIPQRQIGVEHLLYSPADGLAILELMWERISRGPLTGAWAVVDQIDRPMRRFAFERTSRALHIRQPLGRMPVKAPPYKFQTFASGSKDTPWGSAVSDELFWQTFLKRHAGKYWAVWVELFASPRLVGTYKARQGGDGTAEAWNRTQVQQLVTLMQEMRNGTMVAMPEGFGLKFLESVASGDAGYTGFISWCAQAQALHILGEVDTSGLAKGPGSFAKNQVSNDVRLETLSSDAHALGSFETETIVRWLVDLNFGPDEPAPAIVYDATDASDRAQRRDGIQLALDSDVPVPLVYFSMTTQVPVAQEGEDVIVRKASAAAPPVGTPRPAAPPDLPEEPTGTEEEAPARSTATRPAGGTLALAANPLNESLRLAEERNAAYDAVVASFAPATLSYFEAQRDRAAALFEAGAAGERRLLQRLVEPDAAAGHAETIQTALLHGVGLSVWILARELGVDALQLSAEPDWTGARTPAAAIEFWERLLQVGKGLFRGLADALRRLAFTVAGVTEATLLQDINRLVGRSLAEGLTRADFVRELTALYERQGFAPTSKWHADLIYTTSVRNAAHLAHYQQTVGNPKVHGLIPYLVVHTLGDDLVRQRPQHDHRIVDGLIFAIGHDFWKTWWPLFGFSCRCVVGSISAPKARRMGLVGAEPSGPWPISPFDGRPARPDPGFDGAPDLEVIARQQEQRLIEIQDAASFGDSQAADLYEALQALFRALGLLFGGRLSAPPAPLQLSALLATEEAA